MTGCTYDFATVPDDFATVANHIKTAKPFCQAVYGVKASRFATLPPLSGWQGGVALQVNSRGTGAVP
jgi:hypothetical protein